MHDIESTNTDSLIGQRLPISTKTSSQVESTNSKSKDSTINIKATKVRHNKNTNRKQRKSLLQQQKEVLEKNGKSSNEIVESKEKIKNDKVENGDITGTGNSSAVEGAINSNGGHPRNRWRCMQPRVCNYCWKTFSNSFNLKQHIVNVHVQSQGVACSLCEKVVKNKWYLRKHLVTAHGAPLKRVKGNEGSILASASETLGTNHKVDAICKNANKPPQDTINAAAAVAAAAAAANIPLASFVAAANSISQQHCQSINNNNATASGLGGASIGNEQLFSFSKSAFLPAASINGNIAKCKEMSLTEKILKSASSGSEEKNGEKPDESGEEEEEEELIVDN